jgi:hypothetical protein
MREATVSGAMEPVAGRLAALLTGATTGALSDPTSSDLVFEPSVALRPLPLLPPPPEVWAVDGGQALVADARCLQVFVTRASRVCLRQGRCILEDEGALRPVLLGGGEGRRAAAELGLGIAPDCAVDVNLLREHEEWSAVARCVEEAVPGALVLVDGDLQPDWRIPSHWLGGLLERARERQVTLAGVTKRSSLSRGGAPLVSQLESEAELACGPGTRWWAPVARTRPDVGEGLTVLVARLDPSARFAFRVDLPAQADPETVLGMLASVSDDAAFPGYPYPLSVADRLAACAGWVRDEAWFSLEDHLDRAWVPAELRERAFADRHALMERS